jgi:hypoxanthine phosphoribosyltransferase
MIDIHLERATVIRKNAELICSSEKVQAAVSRIAHELNERFSKSDSPAYPLVLGVMGGAVVFTGQLLPQLTFPLEFDFIHVSRYGDEDYGGEVVWKVIPRQNVMNRTVIVLDDILDEGETLAHVKQRLIDMGAAEVILAVFADKTINKKKPVVPDHVGITVPNKFVIGYGMDWQGYWRNLPDVWAVNNAPIAESDA